MDFNLDTATSELRRAVPAFPIDSEWERGNLSYLAFSDFARFICSEAEVLQYTASEDDAHSLSKVPICMEFLERALEQSDAAVRDMVLDCVETLSACQWEQQIKNWAGPRVLAAWGLTQ
jgi:cytochrome c-type biogenesis protein CcmH/NrfF